MEVDYTYIKYNRSELARSLQTKPFSSHLLAVIAQRIKYKDDPILGLKAGQCFMGDYAKLGLTRGQYRKALENLEKWQIVATRTTNRGTIVTLINSDIYDLNASPATNHTTNKQPSNDQQLTNQQPLNKNGKKVNLEEVIPPSCPHLKIIELYHEHCPDLPRIRSWEGQRKENLKQRFKGKTNLEWWEWFFKTIHTLDFYNGRADTSRDWKANLEWIVKLSNFQTASKPRHAAPV